MGFMNDVASILLVVLGGRADGCRILEGIDLERQVAYESVDPNALRALYADASAAQPDVDQLTAWRERGIGIQGARMVRRSCSGDATSMTVTERLGATWAVFTDGSRRRLPRDGWDTRTIGLQRVAGRWVIARVSPVSPD